MSRPLRGVYTQRYNRLHGFDLTASFFAADSRIHTTRSWYGENQKRGLPGLWNRTWQ